MLKGLGTALVGSIAILTLVGTVMGLLLSDTDIVNPATSGAAARQVDAETEVNRALAHVEIEERRTAIALQKAQNLLDLGHQARTQAQEEKYNELMLGDQRAALQHQVAMDRQQQEQAFKQEMALNEVRQFVVLGVGSGAILSITIVLAYYLYACGRAKLAQIPRAEHDRSAGGSNGRHRARNLATATPRSPQTPRGVEVVIPRRREDGGNGRGPRVHEHTFRRSDDEMDKRGK